MRAPFYGAAYRRANHNPASRDITQFVDAACVARSLASISPAAVPRERRRAAPVEYDGCYEDGVWLAEPVRDRRPEEKPAAIALPVARPVRKRD